MNNSTEIARRARFYVDQAGYRLDRPIRTGNDAAVLLLHGLGGNRDQLWPLVPTGRCTVVAPDQRAHGPWPFELSTAELTFEQLAQDQLALLDRLGLRVVSIVGVSMGAGVAVAIARMAPGRVAGLLLIRPAWLAQPFPPNLDILVRVGKLLERFDRAELAQALLDSKEYQAVASISAAAAASARDQLGQPFARHLSLRLRQMPASAPLADLAELGAIRAPATVVAALDDPMHPADFARQWADRLPGATYHVVPSRDARPVEYDAGLRELCARFVAGAVDV